MKVHRLHFWAALIELGLDVHHQKILVKRIEFLRRVLLTRSAILWDVRLDSTLFKCMIAILGNQCPICNKQHRSRERVQQCLNRHVQVPAFECRQCSCYFTYYNAARMHILRNHEPIRSASPLVDCPFCAQKVHMTEHMIEMHFELMPIFFLVPLRQSKRLIEDFKAFYC